MGKNDFSLGPLTVPFVHYRLPHTKAYSCKKRR